jgi:NAD(P)-dependent dehydrogenase (short-subunit alcohol dehydrogenase family)
VIDEGWLGNSDDMSEPIGNESGTAGGRNAQRAVLVTGASSGIGRRVTECLAAEGHFVYACARKEADLAALESMKNVQPLRLDVTSQQDIDAAVAVVARQQRRLYGLVNNAGVATIGPVVGGDDAEFGLVMGVNLHGPYRVTKAFAPLIIAAQGRITMIGSVSGILAPKDLSAYCMSKHAIEAFTDSLAAELEPHGVNVSVIEPGNFRTEIARNGAARTGTHGWWPDLSKCKDPDEVAAAVVLALFEPTPKRRYLVVSSRDEATKTLRKQIEQLVQLNDRHAHTFARDELVGMLDEELGRAARTGIDPVSR